MTLKNKDSDIDTRVWNFRKVVMADNNRSRLLLLLKYLQKNTDDEHVASVADITEMLENRGINGNRNTIRDDVKALNDAGYEILANVGPSNSKLYHYGARPFDQPELKLLIDAVSSSQFIGVKQSQGDLIDKICELTSKHEAEKLVARVYTSERIKTENSKLLYVVDKINEAIDTGKKIRFQYMEYNVDKELEYYGAAEPPVRCGESHLSGLTEPPQFVY